ncbi:hypothetical protein ABGB18_29045 [Nonomuraea sp. B12E4]|uniref:hypothetical protein n=1 Tax=Nonomuraea sp. B12E4 TaxID=3153564 RepID=UPI00325F8F80
MRCLGRIGIMGGSYGGCAALAAVTPDYFAMNPVSGLLLAQGGVDPAGGTHRPVPDGR